MSCHELNEQNEASDNEVDENEEENMLLKKFLQFENQLKQIL